MVNKKFVLILFFLTVVTYCFSNTFFFDENTYKLSFWDYFDEDDLDFTKWTKCKEQKRQNLDGWWKDSCVYIDNGCLVIECLKDKDGVLCSGGITSKGKFSQNQGLFEIQFKVTKASALWYAFWLNTPGMFKHHLKTKSAAEGVEIDIFEILPSKRMLCTGIHYGGYEYYDNKLYTKAEQFKIESDFFDNYHNIKFSWDEDAYKLWLDDLQIFNIPVTTSGGVCLEDAYVLISAEFGKWGGDLDFELLPSYMYVDYVKVYEKL